MLPTRSSAGRAQSARRARSSCSRQLPVGSMVSTFTQVPGLEETARSKKTKEQRFLNSSTKILSHLDKTRARKTSTIAVQLLLQNTHNSSMHTHIQHPSAQVALWNPCHQLQLRTMDQAALIPAEATHTLPSPTTPRADSVT